MPDHAAAKIPLPVMTGTLLKRPAMFMGLPTRFDRMTAFIAGYTMAVETTRAALSAAGSGSYQPVPVESEFAEQLRSEGRLRWGRWDLTIAAEAIGWEGETTPVIEEFTDEQHRAAIEALSPLLDRVLALPEQTVLNAGLGKDRR